LIGLILFEAATNIMHTITKGYSENIRHLQERLSQTRKDATEAANKLAREKQARKQVISGKKTAEQPENTVGVGITEQESQPLPLDQVPRDRESQLLNVLFHPQVEQLACLLFRSKPSFPQHTGHFSQRHSFHPNPSPAITFRACAAQI
jgi:hypothetical protein